MVVSALTAESVVDVLVSTVFEADEDMVSVLLTVVAMATLLLVSELFAAGEAQAATRVSIKNRIRTSFDFVFICKLSIFDRFYPV